MYVCVHLCMRVYLYIYIYMHVYVAVCVRVYTWACLCRDVRARAHTRLSLSLTSPLPILSPRSPSSPSSLWWRPSSRTPPQTPSTLRRLSSLTLILACLYRRSTPAPLSPVSITAAPSHLQRPLLDIWLSHLVSFWCIWWWIGLWWGARKKIGPCKFSL